MKQQLVKFLRRKDFELVRELGRGACGKTVLLHDPVIAENFVCKKYSPLQEEHKEELYSNFVHEIKLLHLLNHPNIVRVFNYYLYPEEKTGYILMEFVEGKDIEDYSRANPENINSIFVQAIEAFYHLELNEILHRDIRPLNILVSDAGDVKVIDFGFGKKIVDSKGFDKSISLNWWCEPPNEFSDDIYDHSTEVYFVGKLFESMIIEGEIEQFAYKNILGRMTARNPENRIRGFSDLRNEILSGSFGDIEFDPFELKAYRTFAQQVTSTLSKIERSAKYVESPAEILRKLEDTYRSVMLEVHVPTNSTVLRALVNGSYYFSTKVYFDVSAIKNFLDLLRHASAAKRNIIIANLKTRLDAIERYDENAELDDDIPF
ncbi:MAG: kinase [Proteobacteria bacterium SG_bin4]|nr:MAG: kinase [Proteobacteria bacterium SG_bin4]